MESEMPENQQLNVARAAMYPSIVLSADLGFQSLSPTNLFGATSFFNNLSAGVTQPVFQKRKLKTRKEVANKRLEIAQFQFQEKVLNASIEVNNLLSELNTTKANLTIVEQQETALLKSYKDSQLMLANGLANYLDVLNAQSNLLAAQLGAIELKSNKLKLITRLYRAVGGGSKM